MVVAAQASCSVHRSFFVHFLQYLYHGVAFFLPLLRLSFCLPAPPPFRPSPRPHPTSPSRLQSSAYTRSDPTPFFLF